MDAFFMEVIFIKIKQKHSTNNSIKQIDKLIIANEKFKENIINISTKDNEQSINEYTSNKLKNIYENSTKLATYNFNKYKVLL